MIAIFYLFVNKLNDMFYEFDKYFLVVRAHFFSMLNLKYFLQELKNQELPSIFTCFLYVSVVHVPLVREIFLRHWHGTHHEWIVLKSSPATDDVTEGNGPMHMIRT